MNSTLKLIKSDLKKFFTYFKDTNVLAISEDKVQLPFAFIIVDNGALLLSIAVDYPNAINIAHIALVAREYGVVGITHPFYISLTDGHTYVDDEAFHRWDMEAIDLASIEPEHQEIN